MASKVLKDASGLRRSGRTRSTCSSEKLSQQEETGSEDLFNSQASSQLNTGIDITLQLTEYLWVQCDNPDCQKWRKIPVGNADSLEDDAPWYCRLNPDPIANSCEAPEEDHAQYDRMAKQAGIKFVMSKLQPGCLVWAKIAGYCSWPAMVTVDPGLGVSMWLDEDGDPSSYHVEFLGNPHSHCWVAAKQVEVYGHKKIHAGLDTGGDSSQKSAHSKKKYKKKNKTSVAIASQPKLRQRFGSAHIDTVIQEAELLMKLVPSQRLEYSMFKPRLKQAHGKLLQQKKHRDHSACKTCGQHKKDGATTGKPNRPSILIKRAAADQQSSQTSEMRRRKRVKTARIEETSEELDVEQGGAEVSADEGISDPTTIKSEPSSSVYGFDSPDQFSQSKLKFRNPLNDKTKEEKFTIDINMYRKNEQAFEHDVRRFMSRNGLKIRNTPVWNNIPVRLFQLFLAVYERGGYYKVTEKKHWTAVYRELTEHHKATNGNQAKFYYQKNLLPYELYINGKDYSTALATQYRSAKPVTATDKKENVKPVIRTKAETKQVPAEISVNPGPVQHEKKPLPTETTPEPVKHDGSQQSKMFDNSQSQRSSQRSSQDISKLLGKLEDEFEAVVFEPTGADGAMKGVGVKFHDDTTESSNPKYNNAASEFQNNNEPDETGAATAPRATRVAAGDNGLNLGDVEDKILHEMRALEDSLKEMNEDLDQM